MSLDWFYPSWAFNLFYPGHHPAVNSFNHRSAEYGSSADYSYEYSYE